MNSPMEGLEPLLKLSPADVAAVAVVVAGIMIVCDGSPFVGIAVTGPGPDPGTFDVDEDDGAGSSTTPLTPPTLSSDSMVVVAADTPFTDVEDDDAFGVDRTATTSWYVVESTKSVPISNGMLDPDAEMPGTPDPKPW